MGSLIQLFTFHFLGEKNPNKRYFTSSQEGSKENTPSVLHLPRLVFSSHFALSQTFIFYLYPVDF